MVGSIQTTQITPIAAAQNQALAPGLETLTHLFSTMFQRFDIDTQDISKPMILNWLKSNSVLDFGSDQKRTFATSLEGQGGRKVDAIYYPNSEQPSAFHKEHNLKTWRDIQPKSKRVAVSLLIGDYDQAHRIPAEQKYTQDPEKLFASLMPTIAHDGFILLDQRACQEDSRQSQTYQAEIINAAKQVSQNQNLCFSGFQTITDNQLSRSPDSYYLISKLGPKPLLEKIAREMRA